MGRGWLVPSATRERVPVGGWRMRVVSCVRHDERVRFSYASLYLFSRRATFRAAASIVVPAINPHHKYYSIFPGNKQEIKQQGN